MSHPICVDLADIVHQSEQPPLDIHLGFGTQGEAIQSLLNADVGKHRLDNGQAPGIDLFTLWGVYFGLHLIDQVGLLIIHPDRQVPARRARSAQTAGPRSAAGTICAAGTINIINPITIRLSSGSAFQQLALRTAIGLFRLIEEEISFGENAFFPVCLLPNSLPGVEAILEPGLSGKALISFAELDIGDIGIQVLSLAHGQAVIIAVCAELFACKIVLFFADGLQGLLCSDDHRRQVLMILAVENLRLHDDLMLFIHQRLGVIPLDHPVRGGHLRRLVIGHIALDLFPTSAHLRLVLLQKLTKSLHLMLQPLLLFLASFRLRSRLHICLEVLSHYLAQLAL